ncbi:MAG TPA: sigma-70 domain-containing protein [Planctomycetota bacterium]|nr:sigma-70 domain-containing protein [Planctomycetota bacterium]
MNDETRSRLRDITKKLIQSKGREPSVEEVAEAAQVPVEEVRRVVKISYPSDVGDDGAPPGGHA